MINSNDDKLQSLDEDICEHKNNISCLLWGTGDEGKTT